MTKVTNMTTGKPAKLIFLFALPLMFGNVFQQLYRVVDTAIVGQGVGMDALAALGTTDWLCWLVLGVAQGFTQGFSVHMAQKFGEGDLKGLKKTIGVSAVLTLIITLIIELFSQLLLSACLTMLRVPAELWPIAEEYTRIFFIGIPAMMFFNFTASILRAVGDSKTPLYAMILSSIINVVLDILAVFVWNLGVAGAAWATVIAQCCAGAVCLIKIIRTSILRFGKQDMKLDRLLVGKLLYLGCPISFQNIIICVGGMILQSAVNEFGKDSVAFIAGFTATNKLYGLLEMAAVSYGAAVTTYIGQNFGASNMKRIRQGVRTAVWLCLLTSAVISIIMLLFGKQFSLLFISAETPALTEAACAIAYRYLSIMSIGLPILYLLYVYLSAMIGLGRTILPMISGIVECIMRVSFAIVASTWIIEDLLFFAEPAAWLGATTLLFISYRITYPRLEKKIEAEQNKEG